MRRDFNAMIDREFAELVYNDKIQHCIIFSYIKENREDLHCYPVYNSGLIDIVKRNADYITNTFKSDDEFDLQEFVLNTEIFDDVMKSGYNCYLTDYTRHDFFKKILYYYLIRLYFYEPRRNIKYSNHLQEIRLTSRKRGYICPCNKKRIDINKYERHTKSNSHIYFLENLFFLKRGSKNRGKN